MDSYKTECLRIKCLSLSASPRQIGGLVFQFGYLLKVEMATAAGPTDSYASDLLISVSRMND
jgi:hypothetical protein